MATIGSFLKTCRLGFKEKVTLTKLATFSGLSQPYLSMIETDKKSPTVDSFFKIIETLSIFGENLYEDDFTSESDVTDNRLSWIESMLDDYLDTFGFKNQKDEWTGNEDLSEIEYSIFEASANYRQISRDVFPLEYLESLKKTSKSNEPSNLNTLVSFLPYKVDLNLFFNEKMLKNIELTLDDIPISNEDLIIIRNTLNGIRFNKKQSF